MRKTLKILTFLLIAITLISFTTTVFAKEKTDDEPQGYMKPSDLDKHISYGDSTQTKSLQDKAGQVMGLIRNVAVIASVIIIMVLGVKYMLGSVEEKAEYKKSFMPLIIGIVLVVAATSIASFIFGIVS